jgi:ribosomal protein S18 acetylase RimI-like enzyme
MNQLNYRKGSLADLQELKELGLKAYGQFQQVLTPDNWEKFRAGLADENKLIELVSISTVFICETEKKKIIGMAILVPSGHPMGFFLADWSSIRRVGVDTDYRGHGIAKQLTRLCIDHARQANEKYISLHTSEFMNDARHIYESLGFKMARPIDDLFGKKYWLYLMELEE